MITLGSQFFRRRVDDKYGTWQMPQVSAAAYAQGSAMTLHEHGVHEWGCNVSKAVHFNDVRSVTGGY